MENIDSDAGLHVTEGMSGTWFYHLSVAGVDARGLCGAQTMHTAIPRASWGAKGHLNERYCHKCANAGEAELRAVGVAV